MPVARMDVSSGIVRSVHEAFEWLPHARKTVIIRPMGITIPGDVARARFSEALELAESDAELPAEWIDRTLQVGTSRNITFTPVLGTALLAKAADRRVDAFSLREDEGHRGYSARSLAKEVLVPCCVRARVDIRTTGAEPLNNQPFLRASRITTDLNVRANAAEDLVYLCDGLRDADFLENEDAVRALAAFLRARIQLTDSRVPVAPPEGALPLRELLEVTEAYLLEDSEGGKTGQAITAAIFDLLFETVRTKRINDPSSKWPGDVGAFQGDALVMSAEVKQRPFSEAEIMLFVQRLSEEELQRAVIVALGQGGSQLEFGALAAEADRRFGVDLMVVQSGAELLRLAVRTSKFNLGHSLQTFPSRAASRLTELEVSSARREAWRRKFPAS